MTGEDPRQLLQRERPGRGRGLGPSTLALFTSRSSRPCSVDRRGRAPAGAPRPRRRRRRPSRGGGGKRLHRRVAAAPPSRASTTSRHPRQLSSSASARPSPLDAPVMTATRSRIAPPPDRLPGTVGVEVNFKSRARRRIAVAGDLLTIGTVRRAAPGSPRRRCATTTGRGIVPSVRSPGGQRRYPRSALRRIAFIRAAQNVGLSLDEIREALGTLPDGRPPTRRRLGAAVGVVAVAARRADRGARRRCAAGSTSCIGCGCLSLGACALMNPDDSAARSGPGARFLPAPLRRPHGARRSARSRRRTPRADRGAVGPADHQPLGGADVRDAAHALAGRVVDADARADVARHVDRQGRHVPALASSSATWAGSWKPSSLTEQDHPGRGQRADERLERVPRRRGAVEGAAGRAAVDPLARHAVGLGAVAADDGLPHVVVREVGVLVVGRVEVGRVDAVEGARPARGRPARVTSPGGPGDRLGRRAAPAAAGCAAPGA